MMISLSQSKKIANQAYPLETCMKIIELIPIDSTEKFAGVVKNLTGKKPGAHRLMLELMDKAQSSVKTKRAFALL